MCSELLYTMRPSMIDSFRPSLALFAPILVNSLLTTIHFSPTVCSCSRSGSSWSVLSIIPLLECIKDSSLLLNLKEKTMTPGRAAELWRRPIKLFAFDLILSFLPPRWMSTGERTEKKTQTHIYTSVQSYIAYCISTYSFQLCHFYPFFFTSTDLCTYAPYIPFLHNLTLVPALFPSQWNAQKQKEKKNHKNKKTLKRISEKMMMEQLCENSLACYPVCIPSDCLAL